MENREKGPATVPSKPTKKSGSERARVPSINPDLVKRIQTRLGDVRVQLTRTRRALYDIEREHGSGPGELTIEMWRRDLAGAVAEVEALDRQLDDYLRSVAARPADARASDPGPGVNWAPFYAEKFGGLVGPLEPEQVDELVQRDLDPPDGEALVDLLGLVVEHDVTVERLGSLPPVSRHRLGEWCGAVHLHASDNDDVEVPEPPRQILEELGFAELVAVAGPGDEEGEVDCG